MQVPPQRHRLSPVPTSSHCWCAAAFLVAALLFCLPALAQSLPALTGRVVDNAGMIDPADESALVATLEAFEQKSSDQIVVATIESLGGEAIEPYANRLFRQWGLGQAGENNGVLLLVARDDRRMRIEVGYGLEGTLTDLHSKLIIENTMVPAFRAGDFSGGITRAVNDIIMVLEGNAAELEARAERNQAQDDGMPWFVVLFILVWCVLFFGAFAFAFLAPVFGRKIGAKRYKWLGMEFDYTQSSRSSSGRSSGGGWSSSSGGGGFSGGGGSSGGGGASGSW
ncbi:TPM domain-containing protein [Neoaquamicrobium sediminum]|uniref:TPM domain-containing protein n=1 Tax=Neoaquamicrobium sediminum TaxID=1849104 RepID=UPI003BAD8118